MRSVADDLALRVNLAEEANDDPLSVRLVDRVPLAVRTVAELRARELRRDGQNLVQLVAIASGLHEDFDHAIVLLRRRRVDVAENRRREGLALGNGLRVQELDSDLDLLGLLDLADEVIVTVSADGHVVIHVLRGDVGLTLDLLAGSDVAGESRRIAGLADDLAGIRVLSWFQEPSRFTARHRSQRLLIYGLHEH